MATPSSASKILMMLPLGSASHKNIFTPIAQRLGEKGHDVTLVSMYGSFPSGALAYSDVVAETAYKKLRETTGDFNVFEMIHQVRDVNSHIMKIMMKNLPEYCDGFLRDPAVQHAWNVKPDLVMLPAFMNECGLALVHKFQVPFMYVTTSGLTPWTADIMGNPEHPAFVPNQYLSYTDDMSISQRLINTIMRIVSPAARRYFILNRLESVVQKFLNDNSVSLHQIESNVSSVLVNSHHSLGFPRPMMPSVIEVGGMHCRPAKSIVNVDPQLQGFLDEAIEGNVLLFSLGSHIKSSQMPEQVLSMFVNVFNRLPYDVIWKWEGSRPANLTSNVITRKWLPQQDILGHPSVGGFFTHGGLLSFQEAAYHGVPLVALPLMSDQYTNAKQAATLGMAVTLDLKTLSEKNIEHAIQQIMTNPFYRAEAERRSRVMKDQETHPLDRAVYWTEYIIRHEGAPHLKSTVTKLSTMQYYLIDVGLLLLSIVLIVLFVVYFVIKIAFKLLLKATKKANRSSIKY